MRSVRATDRAREAVVSRLGEDCASGAISVDTLAWRIERAYAARTLDELRMLTHDLPARRLLERVQAVAADVWETVTQGPRLAVVDCVAPADLASGERWIVGRASACDLVLDDTAVSRCHVALRREHGTWIVSDLRSSNGTHLNGRRVDQAVVVDGDELLLGETLLRFRASSA
jgi:hypothetical protein